MWQHIEPDKLYLSAQNKRLDDNERAHLGSCEFCQSLLFFFQQQLAADSSPKPGVKAA